MTIESKHLSELHHHLTAALRLWNQYMKDANPNCGRGEYMLLQAAIWEVESKLRLDTPHTRLEASLANMQNASED